MEKFPSSADISTHRAGVPLSSERTETPLTTVEQVVDRLIEQIRLAFHSGKQRISTSVSFTPRLVAGLPLPPHLEGNDAEKCRFRDKVREAFDVFLRERVNFDVVDGDIRPVFTKLYKDSDWLLQANIKVLFRKEGHAA